VITSITPGVIEKIRNPVLAAYAERYLRIAQDYQDQIRQTGIGIAPLSAGAEIDQRRERLRSMGATFRNDGRSIVVNRISPACEACQTGIGSATFFISLRCHRNCFYCFNPNQENYAYHTEHQRNPAAELERIHSARQKVKTLALTGGEPLLFKQETFNFFRTASLLFPQAHTRLYTCGDHADEATLQELKSAGLAEIRFSIRMHDLEKNHRHVFERIALARKYIPQVMVEMPVLPGSLERMKAVLLELDSLEIHSINLLEFCYPLWNAEEYNQRGFAVKNPPHQVLYDYWYAGGLPVQGSEEVCLDLAAFAIEQGLRLGVHYCSLENKHTGQVYQQNTGFQDSRLYTFSSRDYFLKTAKVFGEDAPAVRAVFKRQGFHDARWNEEHGYLEFPLRKIYSLRKLDMEVVVAYHILETRGTERILREVHLNLTSPQTFIFEEDV
jgi:pyruvate formate-lyase activating enzyme-like uncharacterized protein